jgi:excinuclease ABC subunit C
MIDASGGLIYVGKAKNLRVRLLSYFRRRGRDPKAGRIISQARQIVWEYTASEFGALLRELELIRRWRPRCNLRGQPHRRRRTFVCLGRRPAPYLFLARRPCQTAAVHFGPVVAGQRTRAAVRWLNDLFQLRDCPQTQEMIFADQGELFPTVRAAGCLRHEIGTCLGPCAGLCSQRAYTAHVRAARAFLAGVDTNLLERLEEKMRAASASFAFERAAVLRDQIESIQWLFRQLERLRLAREQHSFIYRVKGEAEKNVWYLIDRGLVAAVIPEPEDVESQRAAAATIEAVYQRKKASAPTSSYGDVETIWLVAGWFRRYPKERRFTLPLRSGLKPRGLSLMFSEPGLRSRPGLLS